MEQTTEKMLRVSRQLNKAAAEIVPAASPAAPLSEQELHILKLFAAGKNSPEIAKELRISLQTLRNHLHHINQKLRTHNRLEAVMHAIQRRLI
jgi:DNA-binding NarL/FixJ family response regulator